jgi:hypothetical protein
MIEKGCWTLYKTDKTGDHEKHLAEQAHAFGLKTILCNAQQVQEYETKVEVNVAGGVLYLDDCHLNLGKMDEIIVFLPSKSRGEVLVEYRGTKI